MGRINRLKPRGELGGLRPHRKLAREGNDHCFGQTMTVRAEVSKHEQAAWPFDTLYLKKHEVMTS